MEPNSQSTIKVALYARVSTEEQGQGQTIKSQIAELERFVEQNGWTAYSRYIDEGWSGSVLSRPELDRLRDDAAKHLFEAVVINDVDRLARDVMHLGVIKRDLEKQRIRLIFRKLPGASDPMNNLMVNILGSFAEFERELIVDRTRRGKRHKVEVRQQYLGCIAPYGYRYIRKSLSGGNGILEINADEAKTVKQMFHWVAEEGLSINKVAERLTRLRIPTRKQKHIWPVPSVHKILRNETYVGTWFFGKYEACQPTKPKSVRPYRKKCTSRKRRPQSEWLKVPLPQEFAIVDRAQWLTVQQQLDKNRRLSPRNVKFKYLLQGLLRCNFCSSVVTGRYCRDAHNTWVYYICRSCKTLRWVPRNDLETVVWRTTKRALLDPRFLESRTRLAAERIMSAQEAIQKRRSDLSLKEIESREAGLLREYQIGNLSATQLTAKLEGLKHNKSSLLQAPETASVGLDQIRKRIAEYHDVIKRHLGRPDFEIKQQILRHLISRVYVSNEFVRIQAELPVNTGDTRPALSAIASTTSTERMGNCGALKFELTATLPHRKKRLRGRAGGRRTKNSPQLDPFK